jgi:hypothetical protein
VRCAPSAARPWADCLLAGYVEDVHPELETGKTMVSRAAKKTGKRTAKRVAARTQVQKGSRRAESWVYAVINPLIDVLTSEVASLTRGRLSWRAHERRLEFIRPPRLYLMPNGRTILDDFEQVFPKEAKPLQQHEARVEELTRRAEAAYQALLGRPEFGARVRQLMKEHQEEYQRKEKSDPWAGWSEEEVVSRVAEYLINEGEGLERTHEFFRKFVPLLQEFRTGVEFSRLQESTEACRDDAVRLIEHLRTMRFRLCNEYDIPAAPVEGLASAEQF